MYVSAVLKYLHTLIYNKTRIWLAELLKLNSIPLVLKAAPCNLNNTSLGIREGLPEKTFIPFDIALISLDLFYRHEFEHCIVCVCVCGGGGQKH